jgi:hypothetical protein
MRQVRGSRRVWGLGVVIATAAVVGVACETARNPGGVQRDLIPPSLTLTTSADTQQIANGLSFNVSAGDNLGLKDIRIIFSGGLFDTTDTVFNSTVTSYSAAPKLTFGPTSGAGGLITIIGRATDGAGNFTEDTLTIFLVNLQALKVVLLQPGIGAVASAGKNLPVEVVASQLSGIRKIGFLVSPASAVSDPTAPIDSIVYSGPPFANDSVDFVDTVTVSPSAPASFIVYGFAEDSAGRRVVTPGVTVSVLSVATDNTPPVVSFTIGSRVEVSDSILIHATDPSGISWLGFRADTGNGVLLVFDSLDVSAGNLTDVTRAMSLDLAGKITTYPTSVTIRAYACDLALARNCGFSTSSTIITGVAPRLGSSAAFKGEQ